MTTSIIVQTFYQNALDNILHAPGAPYFWQKIHHVHYSLVTNRHSISVFVILCLHDINVSLMVFNHFYWRGGSFQYSRRGYGVNIFDEQGDHYILQGLSIKFHQPLFPLPTPT